MNVSAISALSGVGQPAATVDVAGNGRSPASAEAAQRKQVAGQFEAILVRQMLGKSVGSMLGGDAGVSGTVYGDMMTDVLAQKLTAGGGLGLAHMIEKQLTSRGASLDSSTASAASTATHPSSR